MTDRHFFLFLVGVDFLLIGAIDLVSRIVTLIGGY